jgi:addiction module HigA family antidote
MIPSNRTATHPGTILLKEFLEPMGLTQELLATHVGIPVQTINEIIRGKKGISPDTSWLLSEAFDTSPEFWLNLQATYDLSLYKPVMHIQPLVAISECRMGRATLIHSIPQ